MRQLFYVGVCLFMCAAVARVAAAETMYIKTVVKITLRTGPGTDHKIRSMVYSGQEVEVLEQGDEWSLIRASGEREGWVLTELLSAQKPTQFLPVPTKAESDRLTAERAAVLKENEALKVENRRLDAELSQSREELAALQGAYGALKEESAGYLKVKSDYEKAAEMLAKHDERVKEYESRIGELKVRSGIWYLLVGAGILFAGFLIGCVARRHRRRPSLL